LSIRACHVCKDWSKCQGYDYFLPSDIRFCPHQIMFMVSVRESILPQEGITGYGWPQEPSGYIDQPGKPQPKARASFEGYIEEAVILEQRLAHILVSEIGRLHLARLDNELLQGRKFNQLSDDSQNVVMYLTKQRVDGYAHWRRQRKMRSKFQE
jgi:hypothetical protein